MRKVVFRGPKKLNKTGRKVGTKRADRRWQDPTGEVWDSRYEWIVYNAYKAHGYEIRRCTESDTVSFTLPIRSGSCRTCGSVEVGQRRTYTPDFYVTPPRGKRSSEPYYLETKGYLRSKERSLLRALCAEKPDFNLRILFQRDHAASKTSRVTQWAAKFLKPWKAGVWKENFAEQWGNSE